MKYLKNLFLLITLLLIISCDSKPVHGKNGMVVSTSYQASKVGVDILKQGGNAVDCLLYTSPSPRDRTRSRMPSSA